MAVAITRTDMSARALRAAAAKAADAKAARRMLALALVIDGVDRKTAAESCGMDRQTLRDWVHRYNDEGLDGLSDRRSAGPAPRLSPAQKAELAQMVRAGPDPAGGRGGAACAASTCSAGSPSASASRCMSAPWASSWPRSDFAASRCAVRRGNAPPGPFPIRLTTRNPTRKHRRRSEKRRRDGSRRPAGPCPGQTAGAVVPGVSRIRKRSGGAFSRRTPGSASRAPSRASGPTAAAARAPRAIPATPGPASSAPSAPSAGPPPRWSCRMPTRR